MKRENIKEANRVVNRIEQIEKDITALDKFREGLPKSGDKTVELKTNFLLEKDNNVSIIHHIFTVDDLLEMTAKRRHLLSTFRHQELETLEKL